MWKTEPAKGRASGLMIWQAEGDAHGRKSLPRTINKTASQAWEPFTGLINGPLYH